MDISYFQRSAFAELRNTVGQKFPETGGLLFGDRQGSKSYVVQKFHFDRTSHNTNFSYTPDTKAINLMISDIWHNERLALIGWCHSHPRGVSRLSEDFGNGNGDLGYIRKIFQAIPALSKFLVPIVYSSFDGGDFEIFPYIVERKYPLIPVLSQIEIVDG